MHGRVGHKSDGVYHRLQCPGTSNWKENQNNVCDSSAQTKPDYEVEELETIDIEDFDDTPCDGTAKSRPWSIQASSLQSAGTAMSRRILDEFRMVSIPRSHLTPTDPHVVLDGFLQTQVRGWLLLRNSRSGHKNVQQSYQPSQWSDSDLTHHDRHGNRRSHDGDRKSHGQRVGNANLVDHGDVEGEDTRSTHEQLAELPVGAFGNDGVLHR